MTREAAGAWSGRATAWGSVGSAGGTERASCERLLADGSSLKAAKEMADGFEATVDYEEQQFPSRWCRA